MLASLFELICQRSPGLKRALWRVWYEYLAAGCADEDWTFMNLGFAASDGEAPPLAPTDEPDRLSIQLYHHVVTAIDLEGLDLLEVGCGRGGGCSYIRRYLRPRSVVGVDFARRAIELCHRHRAAPGLAFCHADAESLPFRDATFDVVCSIESSHCYASMARFLAEVERILRPEGYLLLADLRDTLGLVRLREEFRAAAFRVEKEQVITANVLAALAQDSARKALLIPGKVPWLVRRQFRHFAGLQGTRTYEALRRRQLEYVSWILRKAPLTLRRAPSPARRGATSGPGGIIGTLPSR